MRLADYYQAELSYLREIGREFAAAHPEVAHLLAEPSADPDVERLLEGFAFLTAQIRGKLDDEFPEIVHTLTDLVFPEYLRPLPAAGLLAFAPLPAVLREAQEVPTGTEVASVPVEGTACRFRTTQAVQVLPLELQQVQVARPSATGAELRLTLRLTGGVKLGNVPLSRLRLHLCGPAAPLLYLSLHEHLEAVIVRAPGGPAGPGGVVLSRHVVRPAGLASDETLLPRLSHAHPGFRLLHELYALPSKFLAIDIAGLERASELGPLDGLDLVFVLREAPPGNVRPSAEHFALFCTPIVNIFAHDADPILLAHEQTEYRIRPAGLERAHHGVYSVERVTGLVQGAATRRVYQPLVSFRNLAQGEGHGFYTVRRRLAPVGVDSEVEIAFSLPPGKGFTLAHEVVSIDLLCTNRRLPTQLRLGDIKVPTASTPPVVTFRNVTTLTPPIEPPLGGDLHWRLLSHLHASYRTLTDLDALRDVLGLYHFAAMTDRQAARTNQVRLQAIRAWRAVPCDRLVAGAPVRGLRFEAELDEGGFGDEGELFLFATLLAEVLQAQAPLNSFAQLVVTAARSRARYSFEPGRNGSSGAPR